MATTFAWVWDVAGRKGPVPVALRSFSVSGYVSGNHTEPEAYSWSADKVKAWLESLNHDTALVERLLRLGGVKDIASVCQDGQEELAELWPKIGPRRKFVSHLEDACRKRKVTRWYAFDISMRVQAGAIPELFLASNVTMQKRLGRVTIVSYASGRGRRHNDDDRGPGFLRDPRGTPHTRIELRDVTVARESRTGSHIGSVSVQASRLEFFACNPGDKEWVGDFFVAATNSGGAITEEVELPSCLEFPGEELESERMERHMALGGCSYAFTRSRFRPHRVSYACHTCWLPGANRCICAGCHKCHEGHELVKREDESMYCDCGCPEGGCPVPCQASAEKLA
jgi:hypothetical protein